MGLNTKYQSSIGYLGSTRYYFEVRPFDTTAYSDPVSIEEFPLAAIEHGWDYEESANDDKVGIQSPSSIGARIDITRLPADLKNYILSPFEEVDLVEDFPYSVPSILNIPTYRGSTVFIIYTDTGDDTKEKDEFVIYRKYALKPSKSAKHEIVNTAEYKSHTVDVVLVDLFRVIHEGMHPIYFTWLAYNDIENNTLTTPKLANRVWDYLYGNNGSLLDFETVDYYSRTDFTDPVDTAIDGGTVVDGDRVMYYEIGNKARIEIWEYDGVAGEYFLVKKVKNGSIQPGDTFSVLNGTLAGGRVFKVVLKEITDGYATLSYYALEEVDQTETLSKVFGVVDGNFNSMDAYFFPVESIKTYYAYVFDFIYKMQMRVPQSDTNHKLSIISNITQAITFKKQSYKRNYQQGDNLNASDLYFCGLVNNGGVYSGGFYAENDDDAGLFEYDNMWDFNELLKGMGLWISYRDNGKGYRMDYDTFTGSNNSIYTAEWPVKDAEGRVGLNVEENAETKRGIIINVNVDGDNKNEFKHIKQGTIFDEELSLKTLFHNMPTLALDSDGLVETDEYPELKAANDKEIYKYNKPEMPFDNHKLVYFDTPTDFADSEMCIRVHSNCNITLSFDQTIYNHEMPVLPFENDVIIALQSYSVALQKYSCSTNYIALKLSEYFTREGRPTLEILVPIEDALSLVMYQHLTLDYTGYLIDSLGPAPISNNYFVVLSISYSNDSTDAVIKISGRN